MKRVEKLENKWAPLLSTFFCLKLETICWSEDYEEGHVQLQKKKYERGDSSKQVFDLAKFFR